MKLEITEMNQALEKIRWAQHQQLLGARTPSTQDPEWRGYQRQEDQARDWAVEIFRATGLPALLGGEWAYNPSSFLDWWRYTNPYGSDGRGRSGKMRWPDLSPGIDHPFWFRRVGSKGCGTWHNTVLVTHPYSDDPAPEDDRFVYVEVPSWWAPGSTRGWAIIHRSLLPRESRLNAA